MTIRTITRAMLLATTAFTGVALPLVDAQAGGFAIREQSAYYQGMVFAGSAAGGGPSISSMFWNPATMTQAGFGVTSESAYTGIFGDSTIRPDAATNAAVPGLLGLGGSGNISDPALVPASYLVWRPSRDWAFGVAMNSAYGLTTDPARIWAGMFYSRESKVFSVNLNPQVAYQVNEWLSVGVGAQMQYMRVRLDQAFPGSTLGGGFADPDTMRIDADGFGFGVTAGITLTPTPWTTIGLGYRSRINQHVEGQVQRPGFIIPPPPVLTIVPGAIVGAEATLPLPDSVTLSVRQKVTESFTLLATGEWTNWSRFGTIALTSNPAGVPGVPTALPFQWRDGWFASVGAEYQFDPSLTLRTGVGFEQSPITDGTRATRLPDNDRIWVGAGLSYNWSRRLAFDLGYTHIFVKSAPINLTAGNPSFNPALGTFVGVAKTQVDIISLGIRYKWSDPPALVTKG